MEEEVLTEGLVQLARWIEPSPWGPGAVSLNHGLHFSGGEPFLHEIRSGEGAVLLFGARVLLCGGGRGEADRPGFAAPPDPEAEASAAEADPAEALKAKYREALAHKHGSSGAHKTVHGDQGEAAHSQSAGPTQKLFRRKAGG